MRDGIGLLGLLLWGTLTAGCGYVLVRDLVRAVRLRARYGPKVLAVVAFLLPFAAFLLRVATEVAHVHPTVQMTHPDTMGMWLLWTGAWPWLVFGLPVSAVVGIAATLRDTRPGDAGAHAPSAAPPSLLGGIGLLLLNTLAWANALTNFPSA